MGEEERKRENSPSLTSSLYRSLVLMLDSLLSFFCVILCLLTLVSRSEFEEREREQIEQRSERRERGEERERGRE